MSREIKFKFVIDGKHLSKSYTLDEIIEISEEKIFEDMEVCTCNLNESNNHCEGDCIRFENSEITDKIQYPGLKDKNGVEIYEGDICKCHYFYEALGENLGVYEAEKEIIGEIVFQEMGLWIQSKTEEDSGYLLLNNGLHENSFEVLGNIYENPELLNK